MHILGVSVELLQEVRGHKVIRVFKEFRVIKEIRVIKDFKVMEGKVLKVHKVFREFLGLLEHRELKE
jgi:hypothetical protein